VISAWLYNFLSQIVCWIETALLVAFNAVIAALAYLLAAALGLMPNLPAFPDVPDEVLNIIGWVAWVFPVAQAALCFAFIVTAWVLWQLVALLMRWGKLL
jgi:hypothetical protein